MRHNGAGGKLPLPCSVESLCGVGVFSTVVVAVAVAVAARGGTSQIHRETLTDGRLDTQLCAYTVGSTVASSGGETEDETEKVAVGATDGSKATHVSHTVGLPSDAAPTVSNAETSAEVFRNGLAAQKRGDDETAQRLFAEVIRLNPTVVDPFYRLRKVLQKREDVQRAGETFQAILENVDSVAGRFARTLSLNHVERRDSLRRLLDDRPLFAPAVYELARCYSEEPESDPQAWLDATIVEQTLLERFLGLKNGGHVDPHFLDRTEAVAMVDDAQLRLAVLNARIQASAPVRFTLNYNNPSWSVVLHFADPVVEVFLRESADQEFQSLGMSSVVSPISGRPHPNAWAMLKSTGPTQIGVQFLDTEGNLRGPFEYAFDPAVDKVKWARNLLRTMPSGDWAAFGKNQTARRLYFSSLYSLSFAIREVRYGFDRDVPNQVHRLDRREQGRVVPYAVVPTNATFATIQVVWTDGTASTVVRIDP